jgi:hypothetical protein
MTTDDWQEAVPTSGSVELPPRARAFESLGRNHSLETALADLVDNSIDAGASDVLIRLVRHNGVLRRLYVVDNGRGMDDTLIDAAMTLGGDREYRTGDLGHFGIGLKAASFSQASSLTVMSRAGGAHAVGRRWHLVDRRDFHCDIVDKDFTAATLDRNWGLPETGCMTIVQWDGIHTFPVTAEPDMVEEYVTRTVSALQGHLGLMLHRILSAGTVKIRIDVADDDRTGLAFEVTPIDPFGYPVSGHHAWPKDLTTDLGGANLTMHCHVWPKSNLPQFRLPGSAAHDRRQGLYFYRNNRLLHAGGWEGVCAPDPKLQYARVAIDIDADTAGMFHMNAEKSRVVADVHFAQAVQAARAADGTSVADYLQMAQATYVTANARISQLEKITQPGAGLPPRVRQLIEDEMPLREDDPIEVRWTRFANEDFFRIDRAARTLWLNGIYRAALLGGRRGGLNDVPMVKTLLFLLAESLFHGEKVGPKDKLYTAAWQQILTAAAQVERSTFEERR